MVSVKEIESHVYLGHTSNILEEKAKEKGWEIVEVHTCIGRTHVFTEVDMYIFEKNGKKEAAGVLYRSFDDVHRGKPDFVFGPEELLEGIEEPGVNLVKT